MKLLTWNVQWFCGIDGIVSVERVVDEARALIDFDVLCLQEVAIDYPQLDGNAGFDQLARLQALLPGYQIAFGAAVEERGRHGGWQRFGNLVASRWPIAQVRHHALPYPADGGVRSMPRMCTAATVMTPAFGPVRVMTTHLEFYSKRQRLAQAQALADLHAQACAHAAAPPLADATGHPFQSKPHTASAILCGDFNFEVHDAEYALLQAETAAPTTRLFDAWRQVHGTAPHPPTFRLHDRRYGPLPITCDFVFASADLAPRIRRVGVDAATRASDHQPVFVELG